ncbi:50S ribosomal protein L22 [Patescibacteria group bacterium]
MEYKAISKYIRVSPRKMRLVADSIRHVELQTAIIFLSSTKKSAALPLKKVLESAIANAKAKNVDIQDLQLAALEVTEGPVMKRWHSVSRGRAHGYKKRMTHVRVILKKKQEQQQDTSEKQMKEKEE